jgi:hypothetical protein
VHSSVEFMLLFSRPNKKAFRSFRPGRPFHV